MHRLTQRVFFVRITIYLALSGSGSDDNQCVLLADEKNTKYIESIKHIK